MRRPDSLATALLALARTLGEERPGWCAPEDLDALRAGAERVLAAARAVVAREGVDGAPAILGLGRRTIQRAREPGGPLAP